jgi:hypothetical protein
MTAPVRLTAFAVAVFGVACASSASKPANNRDTMTQRQKDSVLGQSGIPGAQGVTQAMKAADKLDAIRKHQDSAMNAKPDTI